MRHAWVHVARVAVRLTEEDAHRRAFRGEPVECKRCTRSFLTVHDRECQS